MAKKLNVGDLVKQFHMEVVCGETGLKRHITVADLHRPGLEMAGYFDYHPQERVQILGKTELAFFEMLTKDERFDRMNRLCVDAIPCIVITRGLEVPEELYTIANERQIPVIRCNIPTTLLASQITYFLENKLAPSTTIHGVLVDVYGIGILISGSSGIGKSETALELVKRGHLLIADDAVEIRQSAPNVLVGNAPELIKHFLEIRGVGIINVMTLFGAGAVRNNTKISVVVNLEIWQQDKQYDRLGLDEETTRIIDTDVTLVTIPVRPGRNLSVIVEVVAMNFRLKKMGFNAAQQFTNKLTETLNSSNMDENEDWD